MQFDVGLVLGAAAGRPAASLIGTSMLSRGEPAGGGRAMRGGLLARVAGHLVPCSSSARDDDAPVLGEFEVTVPEEFVAPVRLRSGQLFSVDGRLNALRSRQGGRAGVGCARANRGRAGAAGPRP